MLIYRNIEPASGSVLVVDIDGVIADASAHQHFLNSESQKWEEFFEASLNSRVLREGKELVKGLSELIPIFLMTARPSYLLEKTVFFALRRPQAFFLPKMSFLSKNFFFLPCAGRRRFFFGQK